MLRALGFLLGIAIATVLLLSLLDVGNDAASPMPTEPVSIPADLEPEPHFEPVVEEPEPQDVSDTVAVVDEPEPNDQTLIDLEQTSDLAMAPEIPQAPIVDPPQTSEPDDENLSLIAEEAPTSQWHSFWKPFHSELSAKGFTQRLERITGLDYRIVRIANGEYEVAFAYTDEEDRRAGLYRIQEATGLQLRGNEL